MRQGPLLSVPGTNNLIVPWGTNISQTQGQDTHFSHMGGGTNFLFRQGGKHYFHIVGEDKLFYTQGGGEIFRHKINIRS